jgi:molybdenum cofactor cytidylyltransferase
MIETAIATPSPDPKTSLRSATNSAGSRQVPAGEKKAGGLPQAGAVTGILLLAGCSSRMGSPKPLLTFGDHSLISIILNQITRSALSRVIVVLGHQAKAIKKEIQKSEPPSNLKILINPEYKKGLSTSITTSLSQVGPQAAGIMFLLGDQPLLTLGVINKLIKVFLDTSGPIVVPLYGKRPGNPVIFRTSLIPELQKLSGDTGGRELVRKYWDQVQTVSIRPQRIGWDVDTWEEYQKIKKYVTRQ